VKLLNVIRYIILVALAGLTFFPSLIHIHDTVVLYGQSGNIGWSIAISVDLLAVAAAAEIIERVVRHQRKWDAIVILMMTVFVSIAAQVVTAQQSLGGWAWAVWPAVAFLSIVFMIEFRPRVAETREPVATTRRTARQVAIADDDRPDATPHVTSATVSHDHVRSLVTPRGRARDVAGRLLVALADGPGSTTDLARRIGVGRSSAAQALARLADAGEISRDVGVWSAIECESEQVA
jgi:hypothetical protein